MFHLKLEKNIKKIQVATAAVFLVCGFFLMVNFSAAVGLEVGSPLLGLSGTQNLYYGNIASTSSSTSGLMLLQKNSVDMFKVDNAGNIFANGDFEMGHNKSIKINSASIDTTLLLGNYLGATTTFVYGASGINKVASLAVEGDVKADRLCIEDDCKAAWSEIVSAGGGGTWVLNGSNLYASSTSWNVGIGTTGPVGKLDIQGTQTILTDIHSRRGILNLRDDTAYATNVGAGITFGGKISDTLYYNFGAIKAGKSEATLNDASGYLSLYSSLPTGVLTERMRITTGGNVGIGTTTPSQQLEITKNFRLPETTGTTPYGIIYKGATPFIHDFNYGLNSGGITTTGYNVFIGPGSGNFTMGSTATQSSHASALTAVGYSTLSSNTTGYNNAAFGASALSSNTTGHQNTAVGRAALSANTTGFHNTAQGMSALSAITTGYYNSALGVEAGRYLSNGTTLNQTSVDSIFIGRGSMASASGRTNEIVIGSLAIGNGSDSVTLGNSSITKTVLRGNVGIGTTTPATKLQVYGNGTYSASFINGNVGIGTTAPNDTFSIGYGGSAAPADDIGTGHNFVLPDGSDDYALVNVGYLNTTLDAAYLTIDTASTTYLHLAGGTMSGDINMGGGSSTISNLNKLIVDKITATTIDPLYNINKINYSTFAPSIAGGVKEEFVGKANIKRKNKVLNEYEYIIDFNSEHEGTDLWVWRKVVDYGDETVQVLITPSKKFAAVYYVIENNKLIFRADKPVEISYRLVGSRFDWRKWPTKALDQSEMGTVVK